MPKLAAFAVVLENGLAMNLRTSPRLEKKQADKQAAEVKATKMPTNNKPNKKLTRKRTKEIDQKIMLTRRLETCKRT